MEKIERASDPVKTGRPFKVVNDPTDETEVDGWKTGDNGGGCGCHGGGLP